MCGGAYGVESLYRLADPGSGAAVLVDVAVPRLKLAVLLARSLDVAHPSQAPLGTFLVAARLARSWGWEVVVVPRAVLAISEWRGWAAAGLVGRLSAGAGKTRGGAGRGGAGRGGAGRGGAGRGGKTRLLRCAPALSIGQLVLVTPCAPACAPRAGL